MKKGGVLSNRKLLSSGALASLILPSGVALHYLMNVLFARVLTTEEYGLFSYGYSLASILALAATLGFSSSIIRFIAEYRHQACRSRLAGVLIASFASVTCAALIVATALGFFGQWFSLNSEALAWSAALMIPMALDLWREATLRGFGHLAIAIIPRQVLFPLLAVVITVIWTPETVESVLWLTVGLLCALEVIFLLCMSAGSDVRPLYTVTPAYSLGEWLKVSLPIGASAISKLGIMRWDLIAVGAFASMQEAGSYAAASRTALLASLLLRVINLVVAPSLAHQYHGGDIASFRRTLFQVSCLAFLVGLPIFLFIWCFADAIIGVFGVDYAHGVNLLRILAIGQFVNLVTGPVGLALTMSRYEAYNFLITFVAAASSLVGLLLVVPYYGGTGAAFVTTSVVVAMNVISGIVVWKKLGPGNRKFGGVR